MTEFRIPLYPEDLQTNGQDFPLALSTEPEIRFSDDLAERVIHDLGFNEPSYLLEQSQFDAVYIITKDFGALPQELQNGLLEEVNANLKILSTMEVTENCDKASHRSAVKAYVFFMNWIWIKADALYKIQQQTGRTPRRRLTCSNRGDHRQTNDSFKWRTHLENSVSSVSALLRSDLTALFCPDEIDRRLVDLCISTGMKCLESSELMKTQSVKEDVFYIFGPCSVLYGLASPIASALFSAVQKTEQLAATISEMARFSEDRYADDALSRALICEMTKGSPHDYSGQWESSKGRSQAIKSIAKLLECLGESDPMGLLRQSSALEPYWCCMAYPIRSALVSAMGDIFMALSKQGSTLEKDNQRHQILDRLLQRFLDVNAFTRARCGSVWVQLTQTGCIPLEYWLDVVGAAVDRLQDCASIVRKNALCLLQGLVQYNPFGDNMNTDRFRSTLALYRQRLQDYPPEQREYENGEETTNMRPRPSADEGGSYRQICFVTHNLETATRFTECVTAVLSTCENLLASTSVMVVQEVINTLVVFKQFSVKNVDAALKTAFALVFSKEATLRDGLLTAFSKIYVHGEDDLATAQNLVSLTIDSTVGQMTCLEEILKSLLLRDRISPRVVKALILIGLERDQTTAAIPKRSKIKGAVALLSVCASHYPEIMSENVDSLLGMGFADPLRDGQCASLVCRVLRAMGAEFLDEERINDVACALVQILFEWHMPNAAWFEVTESAVGALYTLFPSPDALFEEILQEMSMQISSLHDPAVGDDLMEEDGPEVASKRFLRFCFLLGQVAVHHMVYVEICTEIARGRLAKERENDSDDDDPMGGVINQQDLELDRLKERTEGEVLEGRSLVGIYAPMISTYCHALLRFLEAPIPVQVALTLALVNLMSIDAVYCQNNLRLLFTLLLHAKVEAVIKENLIMHLSDLIIRFPNLMEPWTSHIYDLLSLRQPNLQRNALLVLTHLILSDMIKVKGHISKMIVLMRAEDTRLRSMATCFVNELDSKATRTFNPIYNIFPEVLSNLLQDTALSSQDFQAIVQYLLKFTKERHGEKLVEKLCYRFESEERIKVWRGLTFSIKCLQLGERGFRKMMEMIKYYRRSVADLQAFRNLKDTCGKVKRTTKSNELKSLAQLLEEELTALHEELEEEDVEIDSESSHESEEVGRTTSELTFAGMASNGMSLGTRDVRNDDDATGTGRKRKSEESDASSKASGNRRTEIFPRLDRIPERRATLDCSANSRPRLIGLERGVGEKLPRRSLCSLTNKRRPDATSSSEKEPFAESPPVESRLSRLSIANEITDSV